MSGFFSSAEDIPQGDSAEWASSFLGGEQECGSWGSCHMGPLGDLTSESQGFPCGVSFGQCDELLAGSLDGEGGESFCGEAKSGFDLVHQIGSFGFGDDGLHDRHYTRALGIMQHLFLGVLGLVLDEVLTEEGECEFGCGCQVAVAGSEHLPVVDLVGVVGFGLDVEGAIWDGRGGDESLFFLWDFCGQFGQGISGDGCLGSGVWGIWPQGEAGGDVVPEGGVDVGMDLHAGGVHGLVMT